jgi:hypothetical protein
MLASSSSGKLTEAHRQAKLCHGVPLAVRIV